MEISKAAIQGLAMGLETLPESIPPDDRSSFQVCLADAVFILVGCTPQNEGEEIVQLLEVWRTKGLCVGSGVVSFFV